MADRRFNVDIVVNDNGTVKLAERNLAGLGGAVDRVGRSHRDAGKQANDFYDQQKKGIIGTANTTKSFSKLAESLGGNSSGIVAAYATLAANIFAVSAAFNALRGAAQVEQIFRGLEAAGTRTGQSLISTANALKEVTGNAIDTEQAMRSTAQIVSAGFDDKMVRRLGQAARDTSFALGRNMTDSLDRLSRGIVKLEPELLDELGIMTKLTESNTNYARQLGKSETQLTSFEKRQGFANAVLAEAELKFGGLSAAAGDATVYDQLAASFKNLTNEIFNFGNIVGKPLAAVLTADTSTLLGVMILFGSTLKTQLLPGLANSVVNAEKSAKAYRDLATKALEAARASRDHAIAQQQSNLALKQNFNFIGDSGPAKYLALRDSIKAGTASMKEQATALNSLNASLRMHESQLQNHKNYTDTPANAAARAGKEATIANIKQEIAAVQALQAARLNSDRLDEAGAKAVREARRAANAATMQARASEQASASIGAASQLKLGEAWKQLSLSVKNYAVAQRLAATEGLTLMGRLQIASFAAGTAVKALGAAFLTALPYIGAAVVAFGLLKSAYEGMKSDATKKLESAIESLGEATSKANDFGAELVRISESQVSASLRAAAAITLQSNAISDATGKYNEFATAFRNKNESSSWDLFGKGTEDKVASWWQTLGTRGALSYSEGLKKGSKALDLAEAIQNKGLFGENMGSLSDGPKQAIALFNTLEQTNKKGLDTVIKARGGYEAFAKSLKGMSKLQIVDTFAKLGDEVNKLTQGDADSVKTFQEAFKNLGNTLADFARTSIPTTPYDNLVKSFNAAEDSATELKKAIDPERFTALLSGLDASSVRALNLDTQQDIEEYNKAAETVQRLKALRKELESRGEKLDATSSYQLRQAEQVLVSSKNLGASIADQITQRGELVRRAQEEERLTKSQLALLQAQLQTNSRIYQNGAAGLKARLEGEQKARDIQVSNLRTQIDVTKTLSGQLQAQIESLKIRREGLELSKLELANAQDQRKAWAETMQKQAEFNLAKLDISPQEAQQRTSKGPVSVDRLPGQLRATGLLLNAWRQAYDISNSTMDNRVLIAEKDKEIAAIDGRIAATQREARDTTQQIAALQNQIKTIREAELDPAQKAAELANAQRQYYSKIVDTLNNQAKSLNELDEIYYNIDARVAGISDRLDYQMSQIRRRAAMEREELGRTQMAQLGDLRANLQIAQADLLREKRQGVESDIAAAQAGVTFAENALKVAQNDYDLSLQKIDATEKLALLEKAMFDSRSEGIEYQRQSLDYLSKTIDAARSLSDAEQERSNLQKKLMAKRGGYEVSDAGQSAMEIEAAKRAYDLAVSESQVKKSLIDLEYALLEAQRDNLAIELQARQSIYDKESAQYKQIEATLGRLANVNFDQAAANAKRAIDVNVQNKFDELQLSRMGNTTSNPIMKGLGAVIGAIQRNDAIKRSQSAPPTAAAQNVVIDKSGPAKLSDLPQNPQIRANDELRKSIDNLRTTIEKWLTDNPLQNTEFGGTSYGKANFRGMSANAQTAMDFFLKKGLTPAQAAGIVGNLQQESTPNLQTDARNGNMRGIAQWDSKRQANFASIFGQSLESSGLIKQLEFLWHEITADRAEAASLRKTGFWDSSISAGNAAKAFEKGFERSGGDALGTRVANAEKIVANTLPESAKQAGTTIVEAAQHLRDIVVTAGSSPASTETAKQASKPVEMSGNIPTDNSLVLDPAELAKTTQKALETAKTAKPGIEDIRSALGALNEMTESTKQSLRDLGPEGELVAGVIDGCTTMSNDILNAMDVFSNASSGFADKFSAVAAIASTALATVQSAIAASARAKTEAIDKEIAAEQKRDGKSAESVAKIASLEKKKDEIGRKQFNTNKKLQMAQAVIATAAGVAQALSLGPILGPIMAGVIAAMGAAQIAIISGTQYQSTASTAAANTEIPTLSIGKRGDTIDLARQNNNVGGELGYLRGRQGMGSNASNYSVIGSAYGGDLPRGYGNTAYVVGEKGPETITPDTPITVRPANDNPNTAPVAATINIHALDASGVEDILQKQQGNIISMLRKAANANGQTFMEDVNTNVYSRPNTANRL